jgi:hypothetical protein
MGGSIFMTALAAHSLRSADHLAAVDPGVRGYATRLGEQGARLLLRRYAAELNRSSFAVWEWTQLALALLLFAFLVFGNVQSKTAVGLALLMMLIVAVYRFFLTPEITGIGRTLDFHPPESALPGRARFWGLHGTYTILEAAKWIFGFILLLILAVRRRREA